MIHFVITNGRCRSFFSASLNFRTCLLRITGEGDRGLLPTLGNIQPAADHTCYHPSATDRHGAGDSSPESTLHSLPMTNAISPNVSTLCQQKHVNLHLVATEQTGAILEVAHQLANHPAMEDFEQFRADLLAREAAGPTHLGNTIALPHARTTAVREILVAAGRSDAGIAFRGLAEPVRLIFVVATPRSQITGYLATVGALARLLRNEQRLGKLLSCEDPAEFAGLLPAT